MGGKGLTHGDLRGGWSRGLRAQAKEQGQEVLARLLAGLEAMPGSRCPSRPYLEGDRRAACCRPPRLRAWTAAGSHSGWGPQGHRPPGASECPSCSSWSTEDPQEGVQERTYRMGGETLRLRGTHKAGGRGGCLTGHVDDERDLGKPACSVTEAKTASEPCRCHLVRSPCAWSGTDQPSGGQTRCAPLRA